MTRPRGPAAPMVEATTPDECVAALFAWLWKAGQSRYDEAVTQLEHALQTAAIVRQAGAAPHLVAAALLHDVGHLLLHEHADNPNFLQADRRHEEVGAEWLARFFPDPVVAPVRLHVAAKRYLCAVDPDYRRDLSPASQRSLVVQGGAMGPEEATRFRASPGSADAIALRRADDRAKMADAPAPPLETYGVALCALLR